MLSTSSKIRIARGLSTAVLYFRGLFGLSSEVVATRGGVIWSLNLKEGIDLAIFVLGGFELRTLRRYRQLIKEGDIVLDIGANVGAHTLPLAELVGNTGKVYSFEPTAFAYGKQQTNMALNPNLAARISAHQMMLVADDAAPLPEAVYSSWPLEAADDLHIDHHGRLMETCGAGKATLDSFIDKMGVRRVDFIKLDVDGNENEVLAGAKAVLRDLRPKIMLELAPYVYGAAQQRFDDLLAQLWGAGYQISDMATGRRLPQNAADIRATIPEAGGLNALASFL